MAATKKFLMKTNYNTCRPGIHFYYFNWKILILFSFYLHLSRLIEYWTWPYNFVSCHLIPRDIIYQSSIPPITLRAAFTVTIWILVIFEIQGLLNIKFIWFDQIVALVCILLGIYSIERTRWAQNSVHSKVDVIYWIDVYNYSLKIDRITLLS